MPINTTVGQLLVNNALPEDMRDYNRTLDKKQLEKLFSELAEKHPDKYREVSHKLAKIGARVASETGGFSFGLDHLTKSPTAKKLTKEIQDKVNKIIDNPKLTDDEKEKLVVSTVGAYGKQLVNDTYQESLKEKNPLALQVLSGSRGNPMNLASLRASDLLYEDYENKVIPLPILKSYSQGLTPAEYWAATYGARQGVLASKFSIADAGYLGKQLNQIMHRKMVTALDGENQDENRGLPVDTDDTDNEGALLARSAGPYKRNQVLTPKILKDLKRRGIKKLLVRSPAVGGPPDGGLYAYDAGVREDGKLAALGTMLGNTAAQAINEPIAQGQLSQKHSGGVSGHTSAVSGFAHVNSLLQIPKNFKGGATHAQDDGKVQEIVEAPGGGYHVMVNDVSHYVPTGAELTVKPGDEVEAGDTLSNGIPNPREIVAHKGVGEGRRYLSHLLRDTLAQYGMNNSRRNVEILAGSLINHVRLNEPYGNHLPEDLVPYNTIEAEWQPRDGYKTMRARSAMGKYLERPILHYSIGTKIRPSVVRTLDEFGVTDIDVHDNPPPFQSEMVRGAAHIQQDPDWLTRMYGSSLKKTLLEGTHRGDMSNPAGTSFVPSAVRRVDFGREGPFRTPGPGIPVQKEAQTTSLPPAPSRNPAGGMVSTPPTNSVTSRNVQGPPAPSQSRGNAATPRNYTPPTPPQPGDMWRSMVSNRLHTGTPRSPYSGHFNPGNLPTWMASAPVMSNFFNDMREDPTVGPNPMRAAVGFGSLIDSRAMQALTRGPSRPPAPPATNTANAGTLPTAPQTLQPGEQPIPAAVRNNSVLPAAGSVLAGGAGFFGTRTPPSTTWRGWLGNQGARLGNAIGIAHGGYQAGVGAGSVIQGAREGGAQGAIEGLNQFGQERAHNYRNLVNSVGNPFEGLAEDATPQERAMRVANAVMNGYWVLPYVHLDPASHVATIASGGIEGARAANDLTNAASTGPAERVYARQNDNMAPPSSVPAGEAQRDQQRAERALVEFGRPERDAINQTIAAFRNFSSNNENTQRRQAIQQQMQELTRRRGSVPVGSREYAVLTLQNEQLQRELAGIPATPQSIELPNMQQLGQLGPLQMLQRTENIAEPITTGIMNTGRHYTENRNRLNSLQASISELSPRIQEAFQQGNTQEAYRLSYQQEQLLRERDAVRNRLNRRDWDGMAAENIFRTLRWFSQPHASPTRGLGTVPGY